MSDRGRGGARGGGRGGDRGGGRGGGRGDFQGGRGGGGGGRGRGEFQGGRGGGGDFQGGRGGRGGGDGFRGGRGGRGGGMAIRGGPPGGRGGGTGGIHLGDQTPTQPSAAVQAEEDALVKVTRGQIIDGFPGRRSYGTKGEAIVLRTNYLHLQTAYEMNRDDMEKSLYRYDVDITGDTLSKEKTRQLISHIVQDPRFIGKTWATDYAKFIITTSELDLGSDKEWKGKLTLEAAPTTGQTAPLGPAPDFVEAARARNTRQFRIQYTGSFTPRHLIDYLRSTSPGAEYQGRVDIVQLINIIINKPANEATAVAKIGGNKFYPHHGRPGVYPAHEYLDTANLGGGLIALRGYFSSVRPAIGRLLINLNVTSGAFYQPSALGELLRDCGIRNNVILEGFIRMLKVEARYVKDGQQVPFMTKTKTIVGFAKDGPRDEKTHEPTFRVERFGNAKQVKFKYVDRKKPNAKEREVTVFDYFRNVHGITLQKPNNPVLNVGTRADPQYLPVELCTLLPGQPYRRLLSGDQTTAMLGFAARFPNLNARSIFGSPQEPGNGVKLFGIRAPPSQPDPQVATMQPFGFRVNPEMLTVPGRILKSPTVNYGPGTKSQPRPNNGSWNAKDVKFARPGSFQKWQALVLNVNGPRGDALIRHPQGEMLEPEELFSAFERELAKYGLRMGQRANTQARMLDSLIGPDNRPTNNRTLEQAYQDAEQQGVRILLVVLPSVDRWLYARIKFYGDTKYGIHTICTVGSKVQKPGFGQGMFFGNLALKFNIKGGGTNHVVPNTFVKPLDNNTMLMGIDVTHPSPGSSPGAPSLACVVASVDEHLNQWPGSILKQKGKQEMVGTGKGEIADMVSGLEQMVLERLDLWQSRHKKLPSSIVVYRDGVSEGQYNLVLQHELPGIQAALAKKYGAASKWPKLAIIVVGKRHHTRFYPTREQDADYNRDKGKGSWNPKPGTVVDRGIGGKVLHEFWLQAHQGLQGTARPAHYVVIKDDLGFEADQLEQFTHNLCYMFNRATKAVSICPPAYYADLLAERGRAYLYSVLQEAHGSDTASAYSEASAEWDGKVHPRLREGTWYI